MRIRLAIAGLTVEIHCAAEPCMAGTDALTALFPRADDAANADLRFCFTHECRAIHLTCNDALLWQGEDAGEVIAAFEWAFYNRVIAMLYPEFISLHAACIGMNGQAIIFAGESGSGKSSLCTAALLDGGAYLSDEYTLLDGEGRIQAFPRPLQWGATTHPAFSADEMMQSGVFSRREYTFSDANGTQVTSLLWHPRQKADARPGPAMLILPKYSPTAEGAHAQPVPRSQALLELAAEMHHKPPAAERVRMLHQRLPRTLIFLRVNFSDVHQAWREIRQRLGDCG